MRPFGICLQRILLLRSNLEPSRGGRIMKQAAIICAAVLLGCSSDSPPSIVVDCYRISPQELEALAEEGTIITCSHSGNVTVITEEGASGGEGGKDSGTSGLVVKCTEQESKCHTADGAPGWCLMKYWDPTVPTPNTSLVCVACDDDLGTPSNPASCPQGCSPIGDLCQGPGGSNGCPLGCCPICY